MKKLFAIVLAVVMVLGVASSAMAFTWGKPAEETADAFATRYKIEVVKLANETGIIGTSKLIEAPGATAVNNASVYFYVRLTVSGIKTPADAVQGAVAAKVSFTSLVAGGITPALADITVANADMPTANGVYYLDLTAAKFVALSAITTPNSSFSAAAIEARCQDTATAKVYAKVTAERSLATPFNSGNYDITVAAASVKFTKAHATVGTGDEVVTFTRDGNGKVTAATPGATATAQDVAALYQWLDAGSADVIYAAIDKGQMYMTDANIRAAFGFDYKVESSITWAANSTPIILDPAIGIGIPKTGDNASVIGFAMIMVAVVAAAVAVKKVNA